MALKDTPRLSLVVSGLHIICFYFCHIGWSALWLSQTAIEFKLPITTKLRNGAVPKGGSVFLAFVISFYSNLF